MFDIQAISGTIQVRSTHDQDLIDIYVLILMALNRSQLDCLSRKSWLDSVPWKWNELDGCEDSHASLGILLLFAQCQKSQSADYQKEITAGQGFNSCDTYALAAAFDNSLVTASEQVKDSCLSFSVEFEFFHCLCWYFRWLWQWSWTGPVPEAWWCWITWTCWRRHTRSPSWRRSTWRSLSRCSPIHSSRVTCNS